MTFCRRFIGICTFYIQFYFVIQRKVERSWTETSRVVRRRILEQRAGCTLPYTVYLTIISKFAYPDFLSSVLSLLPSYHRYYSFNKYETTNRLKAFVFNIGFPQHMFYPRYYFSALDNQVFGADDVTKACHYVPSAAEICASTENADTSSPPSPIVHSE